MTAKTKTPSSKERMNNLRTALQQAEEKIAVMEKQLQSKSFYIDELIKQSNKLSDECEEKRKEIGKLHAELKMWRSGEIRPIRYFQPGEKEFLGMSKATNGPIEIVVNGVVITIPPRS